MARVPRTTASTVLVSVGAVVALAAPFAPGRGGLASAVQLLGTWVMVWGLAIVLTRPQVDGVDAEVSWIDAEARKMQLVLRPPWQRGTVYFITVSLFIGCLVAPAAASNSDGGAIVTGFIVAAFEAIGVLWFWSKDRWMSRAARLLAAGTDATLVDGNLSRQVTYAEVEINRTVSVQDASGHITTQDRVSRWTQGRPTSKKPGKLGLRLDDGRELALDTNAMAWFAPIRFEAGSTVASGTPGDRVVMLDSPSPPGGAGRRAADGLLVFAAPGDARGELRSILRRWRATCGAAAALVVLTAVLPFTY